MIFLEARDDTLIQRFSETRHRHPLGEERGIATTVFVSAEYANRNALLITDLFQRGHEIALHGHVGFFLRDLLAFKNIRAGVAVADRPGGAAAGGIGIGADAHEGFLGNVHRRKASRQIGVA